MMNDHDNNQDDDNDDAVMCVIIMAIVMVIVTSWAPAGTRPLVGPIAVIAMIAVRQHSPAA